MHFEFFIFLKKLVKIERFLKFCLFEIKSRREKKIKRCQIMVDMEDPVRGNMKMNLMVIASLCVQRLFKKF
jgi:hypothetical protein